MKAITRLASTLVHRDGWPCQRQQQPATPLTPTTTIFRVNFFFSSFLILRNLRLPVLYTCQCHGRFMLADHRRYGGECVHPTHRRTDETVTLIAPVSLSLRNVRLSLVGPTPVPGLLTPWPTARQPHQPHAPIDLGNRFFFFAINFLTAPKIQ